MWRILGKSTESTVGEAQGTNSTSLKAGEKQLSTKTRYTNPSGSDEVGFNVVVDNNGVVISASADVLAIDTTSKTRQTAFAQGIAQAIVGKKLSDLAAIDKVGGSSLTTKAFNDALPALKAQL